MIEMLKTLKKWVKNMSSCLFPMFPDLSTNTVLDIFIHLQRHLFKTHKVNSQAFHKLFVQNIFCNVLQILNIHFILHFTFFTFISFSISFFFRFLRLDFRFDFVFSLFVLLSLFLWFVTIWCHYMYILCNHYAYLTYAYICSHCIVQHHCGTAE